jgi:hypothetical protein
MMKMFHGYLKILTLKFFEDILRSSIAIPQSTKKLSKK